MRLSQKKTMPKPKRHHLKAKYRSGLEKQTALVLSECQKKSKV